MKSKLIIFIFASVFLFGLFVFQTASFSDGKLHIVFCDVGQGDAIYIRTPKGSDILIDGGPDDKVLSCLSNHMPFWDRDLELVFATHPDADHITGLVSVLKSYRVHSFNTSKKSHGTKVYSAIQEIIKREKIPQRFVYLGDEFRLSDGVLISLLWPSLEYVDSDTQGRLDTNSFSLVQNVRFGGFNALLTGDVEFEILNKVVDSSLAFNILKLSHHGSKTGTDEKTLELIKPGLSIISAGKNNRYRHPSFEVLALLKKYNLEYKSTINSGDIEVVSDGRGFVLNSN